ncbi:MAG: hypothetical protein QXO57_02625 [Candidatus Aenigmatarchaeota archaeon]
MQQFTLSGKSLEQIEIEKSEQIYKSEFPIGYCLKQILQEEHLWDMRYWNKLKDRTEVLEWVNEIEKACLNKEPLPNKNCGHTTFCISLLLTIHKISKEIVINTILKNEKIKYKEQIGRFT